MHSKMGYFFCFFLTFFSLSALEISFSGDALIVMDKNSGRILYEKNAHRRSYPASMTKIGSGLYLLQKYPKVLETKVEIRPEPLTMTTEKKKEGSRYTLPGWWLEPDGVSMRLEVGQNIPARDLFYGMMVGSANDAINALVYQADPNMDSFIEGMNLHLKEIGCKNTHFVNPSGLHHPEHYTTAYDLARIMQKALDDPEMRRCFSTQSFFCSHIREKKFRQIMQKNVHVCQNHKLYYPKSLGGKTGYTRKAKFNLVSAAKHKGRTLIITYMGCSKRERLFTEVKEIYEKFFQEKKQQKNLVPSYQTFLRKINGAKTILKAGLKKDLSFSFYPSEKHENFRVFIYWKRLPLPIKKNQLVGELVLEESHQELKRVPIYAKETVEPTLLKRFILWLKGDTN